MCGPRTSSRAAGLATCHFQRLVSGGRPLRPTGPPACRTSQSEVNAVTHALVQVTMEFLADPDGPTLGVWPREAGVRSGVLCPPLSRMLNEGWLTDGWEDPAAIREKRPPRRYYEVSNVSARCCEPPATMPGSLDCWSGGHDDGTARAGRLMAEPAVCGRHIRFRARIHTAAAGEIYPRRIRDALNSARRCRHSAGWYARSSSPNNWRPCCSTASRAADEHAGRVGPSPARGSTLRIHPDCVGNSGSEATGYTP